MSEEQNFWSRLEFSKEQFCRDNPQFHLSEEALKCVTTVDSVKLTDGKVQFEIFSTEVIHPIEFIDQFLGNLDVKAIDYDFYFGNYAGYSDQEFWRDGKSLLSPDPTEVSITLSELDFKLGQLSTLKDVVSYLKQRQALRLEVLK